MVSRCVAIALVATLAACDEAPAAEPAATLDARALLVRASLDVRGVRPSVDEIAVVLDEPARVEGSIGSMVDDPRFGERVRALFAPALRTRRDEYELGPDAYGIEGPGAERFASAIAEEALNLVAFVALEDRPLTDILTADFTIVDEVLLEAWPLEPTPSQPAGLPPHTVMARYRDGRPAAGILSTNAFYWRHASTVDNANRGRANAISRALLCADYLALPIDFPTDVDLTDSEAITNAIRENPACTACHETLDPLASHLWGFMYLDEEPSTWARYQPQNERLWQDYTGAIPAYRGDATAGSLTALAQAIALDERFVSCMVRRVYEGMLGRDATHDDRGQLAAHREAFLHHGLSTKALVRSILTDPAYRGRAEASPYGGTPEPVSVKLASPEQLSSSIAALSGYRMTYGGRDVTRIDEGLRALAGGSERGPSSDPSLGHALVQRRLAEAAAAAILGGQADPAAPLPSLLAGVDREAEPSPEMLSVLLATVRSQWLSVDDPAVLRLAGLWRDVAAEEGPTVAWTTVLAALLADPDLALF